MLSKISKKNEKLLRHFRKQARLQGFVSEIEITNRAAAADVDVLTDILKSEGIEINPYVKRRKVRAKQQDERFSSSSGGNPSIVSYLNHVGDIPLMDKGQEINYARQMVFAKNKLLEDAFNSPVIQEFIFRLYSQLRDGVLSWYDIFDTDSVTQDKPSLTEEEVDQICSSFYDRVEKINTLAESIAAIEEESADTSGAERRRAAEKVRALRDDLVENSFLLNLNYKQKESIIENYRVCLEEQSFSTALRTFKAWQKVYYDAKYAIVEANVRLVISIAKRYTYSGMEMVDIIQEGNKGLIKAVENFDYRKGYKFSTYATWWIRQSITRAVNDKGKAIRIPANTLEQINRVNRFCQEYLIKYGAEPGVEDICDALNIPEKKVRMVLQYTGDPISLDWNVSDSGHSTIGDFIPDTKVESPDDSATLKCFKENIFALLEELEPYEKDIIMRRFGLDGSKRKTLNEIGEMFNISRERVRQIETGALDKLRHPSRNSVLKDWEFSRDEFDQPDY